MTAGLHAVSIATVGFLRSRRLPLGTPGCCKEAQTVYVVAYLAVPLSKKKKKKKKKKKP
eukprot:NODE_21491_length_750_cov_10.178170.p3 GENE.NODE_21491_length_750_cov_10.178170~~NODE_21491_length_750_cov_10.178170.p3  ORF type:complete len:59 (+),score=22.59 NODE_21491_length_750_cov_10.178170:439-615(+)